MGRLERCTPAEQGDPQHAAVIAGGGAGAEGRAPHLPALAGAAATPVEGRAAARRAALADASRPRELALVALVAACQEETDRFLRREATGDDCCLELLRRAICEDDQAAWGAVVGQYRGLVLAWVAQHPATARLGEEPDYWVNQVFERFWNAIRPERFGSFPGVAALLRYLKMCAHSVVLDEVRRRAAVPTEPLSEHLPTPTGEGGEAVVGELTGRELWRAIEGEVQDEAERLVARLCLVLDLKPREIHERHPDRYPSVADVYRVKRNLLDRLRRSPAIRRFVV